MKSRASSLDARFGEMPPSSPTPVDMPFFDARSRSAPKISAPALRASDHVGKPAGMIMNSCRSRLFSECLPPLMTFIMGTGRTVAAGPPM